jgi:purine-nucleoside phosphorylase
VFGHKGNLIFGQIGTVDVVCMQGRFHSYEGYSNAVCTLPIKVFKLMGVKSLILTCAAGGINASFKVGDIMIIKDHLAFPLWALQHPLVGENDERFGPRFPPANRLYKKQYRDIFRQTARELSIDVKEGVYVAFGGPNYEVKNYCFFFILKDFLFCFKSFFI